MKVTEHFNKAKGKTLVSGYCQFSADLEAQLPALVADGSVKLPALRTPARRPSFLRWGGFGLQ